MNLPPVPQTDDVKELVHWCSELWHWLEYLHFNRNLTGSATWDPGSIAVGGHEEKEVTVTGAVLGDFAIASFSLDLANLDINAAVSEADTVTVTLTNDSAGAVDLAEGTVYAFVIKRVQ